MKKRKIFSKIVGLSLLAAIMVSSLAGCGNGGTAPEGDGGESSKAEGEAPPPVSDDAISIWAFAQPHADYFEWVTSEYTKKNPDAKFAIEVMANDALQDRLAVIITAGGEGSPDLVDLEQGQFSRYMNKEKMCFEPLNDRLEADGIYEDLVETRLNLYKYEETYYGLEHALCPVTMAYRPDLFEKAGITEFPKTWKDYMAAAEKLKAQGIYIVANGDINNGGGLAETETYLMADGKHFVGEDGKINTTPELKSMLDDMLYLQKNGMAFPVETDEDRWNAFKEDKVATYVTPDWAAGWLRDNVPDQSGKWEMTYLPQISSSAARTSSSGGTGLCMMSFTKKDKDMLWDFMKFSQVDKDNNVKKYEMINLYPPVYDAMEACNKPDEYYGGQVLGELYIELAPEMPAQPQAFWRSMFSDSYKELSYDWYEGNLTTDELIEEVVKNTEDKMANVE